MAEIQIIPESIKLIKLTDEQYFSSEYSEYISNSKLGLINPDEGGSLEKYIQGYSGDYSDSFELGSAVHSIVLQPDEYVIAPVNKPTGKLGLFADHAFAEMTKGTSKDIAIEKASISANYYSGKLTEKRLSTALESCEPYWKARLEYEKEIDNTLNKKQVYLSIPLLEKYKQCLAGINSNPKIKEVFYPSGLLQASEVYNEYALFAEVDVTIDGKTTRLKLKSKLDNFTINHETQEFTLNDLKTSGKPVSFFMGNWVKTPESEDKVWYDGSFQKYHYYRQLGMYIWILSCYLQHQGINYKPKSNIVVVETIPDYKTKVYPIGGKHIKQGLDEFKKLLILVAEWIEKK